MNRSAYLVASGDLRLSADQTCWPAQEAMERKVIAVFDLPPHDGQSLGETLHGSYGFHQFLPLLKPHSRSASSTETPDVSPRMLEGWHGSIQPSLTAKRLHNMGQQFDALTGLYDLRARYYDPALGRFLSHDTYPVD